MMKMAGTFLLCICMSCSGAKTLAQCTKEGILAPCPNRPNCVSTLAEDKEHHMDPISYSGTKEQARERLIKVMSSMNRSKIMTDNGDYIHAVFTSMIFRFKDDVEFLFDGQNKLINFRSASRLGYSDMGVNRKRMEEIKKRFEES
jgi:uncharacterized protein (DUF1499 family)